MNFFVYEVRNLREAFPNKKAPLEEDFKDFELEVINSFGALKNHAHYYIGKTRTIIIYLTVIKDTAIRFFPNEPNPKSPDVPAAHTAYITVYYGDGRTMETIIDDIINAVSPNIKILIGFCL